MSDDMTQRRLGAVVRRLRKARDLTQEQLARKAGITQGHLSHLEAGGRRNPGAATLKRLARALDVPVAELLE
jgi:XRE family aerobic/anaerobic benzoate catabolism transcriptional regulator